LPERIQSAVIDFFNANERWLESVIELGQREGTLRVGESATDIARAIVGGFEGAMLVARPYSDVDRFQAVIRQLLAGLAASPGIERAPVDGAPAVNKRLRVATRGGHRRA
jgi:TetR/AcrR family transcriptional repressor of nem operon